VISEIEELRARLAQVERERDLGRLREAALARISQRINERPLDVEGTLIDIAEAAHALIDSDGARVWLLEDGHLVPRTGASAHGLRPAPQQFPPQPLDGTSANARAWRERRTVAVDDLLDAANHRAMFRERVIASGQRSVMAAPLGRTEAVAGTIALYRMEVRPFNTDEMATLELFANQAAIAIQTARLVGELRERNRQTEEALEVQRVMSRVLSIIAGAPSNLEAVLAEIGHALESLTDSDFVLVSLRSGDIRTNWNSTLGNFSHVAGRDHEGKAVSDLAISEAAFEQNRLIELVGPVSAWAHRYPRSVELNRELGLGDGAFLALPVPGATGPIGVFFLGRRQPIAYSDAHQDGPSGRWRTRRSSPSRTRSSSASCRSAPRNWRWPPATRASSSPTCRTNCARR
jgi:hypothetical protein